MENSARLYAARYQEAYALFNTDRHDECIAVLEEMTYDTNLTLWFRLQVHQLLAEAVSELSIAKEHLASAEEAYAEIIERWPESTPGNEKMHERLGLIRRDMDDMKREMDEDENEFGLQAPSDEDMLEDVLEDVLEDELEDGEGSSDPVSQQTASQSQDLSQVSSVPAPQDDSQTSVGSPIAHRPHLTPVTPRSRFSPGKAIPLRGTPTSTPRYQTGGASPSKRDFEDDEDASVPESPSKKPR